MSYNLASWIFVNIIWGDYNELNMAKGVASKLYSNESDTEVKKNQRPLIPGG